MRADDARSDRVDEIGFGVVALVVEDQELGRVAGSPPQGLRPRPRGLSLCGQDERLGSARESAVRILASGKE